MTMQAGERRPIIDEFKITRSERVDRVEDFVDQVTYAA